MANLRTQPGSRPFLPQRSLRSYHIFMIGISVTVGIGFFASTGEILGISGPGGVLLAYGVVGFVACMVMEGICEMLVNWAIPNPMVEFVRVFVDRDLAIVVGFAYWYCRISPTLKHADRLKGIPMPSLSLR
jgi:amino acid transporter